MTRNTMIQVVDIHGLEVYQVIIHGILVHQCLSLAAAHTFVIRTSR